MGRLDRPRLGPETGAVDAPQGIRLRPAPQLEVPANPGEAGPDVPAALDRPKETQRQPASGRARLAALGDRLKSAAAYEVQLAPDMSGLRVRLKVQRDTRDLITTRPRPTDNNALWFFTSWGHPISRADDLDAAVAEIGRYLVVRL